MKILNLSLGCVVFMACCSWTSSGVIVREYNEIFRKDLHSLAEFEDTYMTHYNEDKSIHTTNANILLGVAEPQCKDQLETAAFRGAHRHAGGEVLTIISLPAAVWPYPIKGCAEVFFYRMDSPMEFPTSRTANLSHSDLNDWIREQTAAKVSFTNMFPYTIDLYYSDESTEGTHQGVIEPNTSVSVGTFLGHIFTMYEEGTQDIVDYMVVDGNEYDIHPSNRLETCDHNPGEEPIGMFSQETVQCDDMEQRHLEFTHGVWHLKRLALNYVQPQMVPPVTKEGFLHLKLPADTYKWLKSWYDKEKMLEELEGSSGPCMNQKKSPSSITHLTDDLKSKLSTELRSTLEGWYGGELKLTSIYGVRKYTNGSVLRMHVDTVSTHVISAIINVDQQLDKEWPLLILDHNDAEHEVNMGVGDMVLYESAKLLHGRPSAMIGSHYDNIFIHYQPVTGWDYGWI